MPKFFFCILFTTLPGLFLPFAFGYFFPLPTFLPYGLHETVYYMLEKESRISLVKIPGFFVSGHFARTYCQICFSSVFFSIHCLLFILHSFLFAVFFWGHSEVCPYIPAEKRQIREIQIITNFLYAFG